ncbi:MAG: hypothetical protein PHS53_04380 [Candidatus Pacebacteria bacterium]|nr:hypothetical protein [Candidatus Paceibacterota bacterium]MDD5357356.1 hypothetical protein [Candidatus Paceibacterota bacterium]
METYPKVYYESKKRTLFLASYFLIPYLLSILYYAYLSASDTVFALFLLKGVFLTIVFFSIFLYFYPASTLELYQTHFVHKKGKFFLTATWPEVETIAFQGSAGSLATALPSAFRIYTKKGKTKLIETKTLKISGPQDAKIDLVAFVRELQTLSGKKVLLKGMYTNQFSKASFEDYAKGAGMIK